MRRAQVLLALGIFLIPVVGCSPENSPGVVSESSGVLAPQPVPVSYTVWATPAGPAGTSGDCWADGPPSAAVDQTALLAPSEAGSPFSPLGSHDPGIALTLTQDFGQRRFTAVATTWEPYHCDFELRLYAGIEGNEVQFGAGSCSSTSETPVFDRSTLRCSISVTALVP